MIFCYNHLFIARLSQSFEVSLIEESHISMGVYNSRCVLFQDQYRLLHFALLEAFTYRETSVPQAEFMDYYKKICRQKPRLLYEEFQVPKSAPPNREQKATRK